MAKSRGRSADHKPTSYDKYYDETPSQRDVLPGLQMKSIKGRTNNQIALLKALSDPRVPYVFGIGTAGTGKTLLGVYAALIGLQQHMYSKVIITRPAIEASGESLGYLPGTFEDKVDPYMRPIFDAAAYILNGDHMILQDLRRYGILEIAPVAFMRGRSFNDAFIILDEAQNATEDQILMILTRLGQGSKVALLGDPTQSDIRNSGFGTWTELLEGEDYTSVTRLAKEDIQRRPEIGLLLQKYEIYKANKDLKPGQLPFKPTW